MYDLKKQLIRHEGVRKKPYRCTAGKLTIGVGRNIEDNGLRDDEIDLMLDNDIAECKKLLQANIKGWLAFHQERQNVLINMCFNLGLPRLLKFKKMLKAMEEFNWNKAAVEMLDSRWAVQVGSRAIELADIMRG